MFTTGLAATSFVLPRRENWPASWASQGKWEARALCTLGLQAPSSRAGSVIQKVVPSPGALLKPTAPRSRFSPNSFMA